LCIIITYSLITRRRSWSFPSIANTLWRVWMMFTRSAITQPEVNGFGWNLGNSEYIAWSCPWQILGGIRAEGAAGARAEILFFCPLNNTRFHRLPVGQISRNLHKNMSFRVRMWGFGKHLLKCARKGSFYEKNCLIKVNDFQLPESISLKILQILESHERLDRLWNVGFPLTPLEWTQWFPWPVARAHGEQFFPQKYSSTTSIGDDFTACCITENAVSRRGLMTSHYNSK